MALKELDLVALRHALPSVGLVAGDVGAIVLVHGGGRGFEVEFVATDGRTVALETLGPDEIEPLEGHRILHARDLTAA